jgi:hypothetical protein
LLFRVADNMIFPVLELYPDGSYRSVLIDPEKQRLVSKARSSASCFATFFS